MEHDHIIQCNGIDQSFPMWDLVCLHDEDEPKFHTDNEGNDWEDCLVQSWWENENISIVHSTDAHYHPPTPGLAVVTTYLDFEGEPLLMSLANAKEWKEARED